jgi:hypothetical protein
MGDDNGVLAELGIMLRVESKSSKPEPESGPECLLIITR